MPSRSVVVLALVWVAPVLCGGPPLWPLTAAWIALRIFERLAWSLTGVGVAAALIAVLVSATRR